MAETLRGKFPCPLCSRPLEVRIDRTGKPYCVCNSCGIQLFIRGKRGVERLRRFLSSDIAEKIVCGTSWEILLVVNRLEELKAKQGALEARQGVFLKNKDIEAALSVVKKEIRSLKKRVLEIKA